MKKNFSILIYENDNFLNSILKEQFSLLKYHNTVFVSDKIKLLSVLSKKKFEAFILNLDDFEDDILTIIQNFELYNKHKKIIGYYSKTDKNSILVEKKIYLLQKPFKLNKLFSQLDNLKNRNKTNKYLMKHLEFIPIRKVIVNLDTKNKEHLTEKETALLNYLFNKRNTELTKNDLLSNIWGVKKDINTHTLETHVYRLKRKLHKLEPNLSFSLTNQNGFYSIRDHI